MPTDINLLIQKRSGFFSEERLLLFSRAAAVVLVVLVLSLSTLFFVLSRDPSIAKVKADESSTIAQLTILQSKTAKYLIVVDRINRIKTITKTKSTFDSNISTFLDQIPSGVSVANFALDKSSLSLSLSAADVSLLGTAVNNFTNLVSSKKTLKNLIIQGLVSDEKGGKYVLTLTGDLL